MQSDSRTLLTSSSSSSTTATATATSSSAAGGKPDRLYVGNLAPTVDEYTLIQVFSKYGKITKMDFMFHKTGVLKGKPRGFAFIEFSNKDDALKAMVKLHDRLLRGRKLVVTYANSKSFRSTYGFDNNPIHVIIWLSPLKLSSWLFQPPAKANTKAPPSELPPPTKGRRNIEPPKTTTLSLLKSTRKPQSAAAQIAAMEAKLASMAKRKPVDEDYIPGMGIDSQFVAPISASASASVSASCSPMPTSQEDQEMYEGSRSEERELNNEEIERAAEELEKELELEILETTRRSNDLDRDNAIVEIPKSGSIGLPLPLPNIGLPAKPTFDVSPVLKISDEKTRKREEAFQKGLKGLPRKPLF